MKRIEHQKSIKKAIKGHKIRLTAFKNNVDRDYDAICDRSVLPKTILEKNLPKINTRIKHAKITHRT